MPDPSQVVNDDPKLNFMQPVDPGFLAKAIARLALAVLQDERLSLKPSEEMLCAKP